MSGIQLSPASSLVNVNRACRLGAIHTESCPSQGDGRYKGNGKGETKIEERSPAQRRGVQTAHFTSFRMTTHGKSKAAHPKGMAVPPKRPGRKWQAT